MRENPIVDYKKAFSKIKHIIKDPRNTIVMDAWNDRVPWFLQGQKYVFLDRNEDRMIDETFNITKIGSVNDYKAEKKKYPKGIVIVENWESRTHPSIQEEVRNTLKKEFDVENLPYNEQDKWSISVYSWGL